jgi:hypothetical protein
MESILDIDPDHEIAIDVVDPPAQVVEAAVS